MCDDGGDDGVFMPMCVFRSECLCHFLFQSHFLNSLVLRECLCVSPEHEFMQINNDDEVGGDGDGGGGCSGGTITKKRNWGKREF